MVKILSITIVKGQGPDFLLCETDLPCGTFPYEGYLSVKGEVASGAGEAYTAVHFPGVPVRVVDVPKLRHKLSVK